MTVHLLWPTKLLPHISPFLSNWYFLMWHHHAPAGYGCQEMLNSVARTDFCLSVSVRVCKIPHAFVLAQAPGCPLPSRSALAPSYPFTPTHKPTCDPQPGLATPHPPATWGLLWHFPRASSCGSLLNERKKSKLTRKKDVLQRLQSSHRVFRMNEGNERPTPRQTRRDVR